MSGVKTKGSFRLAIIGVLFDSLYNLPVEICLYFGYSFLVTRYWLLVVGFTLITNYQ